MSTTSLVCLTGGLLLASNLPKMKTAKSVQTNSHADGEGEETVTKEVSNYRLEAGVYEEIGKK